MSNVEPNATSMHVRAMLLLPFDIVLCQPVKKNSDLVSYDTYFFFFSKKWYTYTQNSFLQITNTTVNQFCRTRRCTTCKIISFNQCSFQTFPKQSKRIRKKHYEKFIIVECTSCNGIQSTASTSCTTTNNDHIVLFTTL